MLYGQSMGSEIGIELIRQLIECGIKVEHAVFDGAPLIKLSVPYKMFMYFKFRTLTKLMKGRDVEEVINYRFLNKFTNGDTASLRPLIEALVTIAPYLTDETVRNETECCYTFDFPKFSTSVQKRMHFLYGSGEKAYKTCRKLVKKAYPHAKMTVFKDYGHMTYSVRNTDKYVKMLINTVLQ